jgi:hypothetical protein
MRGRFWRVRLLLLLAIEAVFLICGSSQPQIPPLRCGMTTKAP